MTMPYLPPRAQRAQSVPAVRSALRFSLPFRRGLTAITGQTATLVRASTATLVDSNGTTVTVGHTMPRWESRTWGGSAALGLRVVTDDLTVPWSLPPAAGTWLIEAINLGTAQTSGAGLMYLGRDDATGARLVVRGTGTTFAVDLVNAAGDTSTATFGTAVSSGHAVQLVVQIDDDGASQRVRIGGTVNGGGVAFSAYGTARARASAWGTDAKLRFNRVGSAGTQGSAWLRSVAYHTGALTVDEMAGVL